MNTKEHGYGQVDHCPINSDGLWKVMTIYSATIKTLVEDKYKSGSMGYVESILVDSYTPLNTRTLILLFNFYVNS